MAALFAELIKRIDVTNHICGRATSGDDEDTAW